jgi:hypothetical protein
MRRGYKLAVWAAFGVVVTASVAAYGTTQRRIRGIITAVDPANVTISPLQGHRPCITGRVDPTRTRIIVDGHPGRPADLRVTENARAELSLDDVWMTIRVDTTR